MRPDGTAALVEFPCPNPNSGPRSSRRASDGNLWFSEHTGNRMGRITQRADSRIRNSHTELVPARRSRSGADGNIWFGEFGAGKIGKSHPPA
jgi:virginiamycin B lyase